LEEAGIRLNGIEALERVEIGAVGEASTVVTPELTVRHFHPKMPAVYGTPFMIYLMEVAASRAVEGSLPEGWVTVGVDVNIRHLAATPVGADVTARARVTEVGERRITFKVEAFAGETVIGRGFHTRAPIELARFSPPANKADTKE
jgi:fluoroacetyl-CoA thioesterase